MSKPPNYITPLGLGRLKSELEALVKKERPETVAVVAWAASNGDRSENADYHYGKKRLREIDRRIRFLTKRIEASQVVDPLALSGDKVVFASTVTLQDDQGQTKRFQIVGEDEIDASHGKISWKSPIARAVLGKTIDDEVTVFLPRGEVYYEIIKIEFT